MKQLILARHARAGSNAEGVVNAVPPGDGLTADGIDEARGLGRQLAAAPLSLGVCSRLARSRETLEIALAGRSLEPTVSELFDEIGFGDFEGRALDAYRGWAWQHGPEDPCPGGGESRAAAALRLADGLQWLLDRPEQHVVVISHGLPVRYVIDAAAEHVPARRLASVPHAVPYRLERPEVERAEAVLRRWGLAPRFSDAEPDAPFGG